MRNIGFVWITESTPGGDNFLVTTDKNFVSTVHQNVSVSRNSNVYLACPRLKRQSETRL